MPSSSSSIASSMRSTRVRSNTSSDRTHAEGPFGTLDAQGFVLVDKGAVIQFQGPAHMVLNGGRP